MEPRSSSRTYGSLDTSKLEKASFSNGTDCTPNSHDASSTELSDGQRPPRAFPSERSSTRNWLAVAMICVMGVGTIMATNRGAASPNTSLAGGPFPENKGVLSGDTNTRDGGRTRTVGGNSLLAETVPAGSVRSEAYPPAVTGAVSELDYTVTNFYHDRDGKPGAQIPWLQNVKLAEPHRDTFLRVTNPRVGYTYAWTVRAIDGDKEVLISTTGTEPVVQFTRLDWNSVTLTEVEEESGLTMRQKSDTVMVKYVRREMRTLTDEEREELLDAMLKIWTVRVDGGNGKEIYGDDYADIWVINRLHFKAASPFFCDHFHDGLGFLTSHAMLTNTFEYSLQKVNPKLTVPYWDFTIEKSTRGGNTEDKVEPQASSPLLQSSWFGSSDAEDGMVKDGRWAFTQIPLMKANNPGGVEADVYAKLRAPWNVNDRAYLTRGMGEMCGVRVEANYPWPTCESHYDLTTQHNTFYSWVWTSLYDPHGPVHVWLGGVLDCTETYAKLKDLVGVDIATNLAYFAFVHRKNLFRSGLWSCEGTASIDTSPGEILESKQCGCLGFDLTQGDDYVKVRNEMVFVTSYIEDFSADTQRRVVATLCNGVMNDGDHLQASSSLDPTFWVTHPTMERLWMFKRLTGTVTDLTWPDEDVSYTDTTTGKTVTESLSLYDETCNGHRGKDVFPFGLASDEGNYGFMARTGIRGDMEAGNTLNNRELLKVLDPRVNALNYIYDTFEWTHCVEDGFDFNDAYNSGKVESKRPTFLVGGKRYPRYAAFEDEMRKTGMPEQA